MTTISAIVQPAVGVLVAEDDADLREAMQGFLESRGMRVSLAASGDEAFARFQKERPTIIVSDINMPNGTGLDLIRRIRQLPADEGGLTPAIAISANADARACFEAGFHFYLAKPIEPTALLSAIADFAGGVDAGRARWTVTPHGRDVLIRFEGHVTNHDMRGAVSTLAEIVAPMHASCRVIVDLTRLNGFTPSVGAIAQLTAWKVRDKLSSGVIIGGSRLARLVALGSCSILGIGCEFAESVPPTFA